MTNPLRRSTPEALSEFEEISPTTRIPRLLARLKRRVARITKGNTTFNTLTPEDVADVEDIRENVIPLKGTKAKGEFIPARPLRKPTKLAGMSDEAFRKIKEKEDRRILDSMSDEELAQTDEIFRQMSDKPKPIKKNLSKKPSGFSPDAKRRLANIRFKIESRDFGVEKRQIDKANERKLMEVGEQRNKQQRRFEKGAFLEPTTTFANSFRKKKHKIPNIKTSKARLEKLAIVRIPRKEHRESRATRINFVSNFVEKSKDIVKGKNIVPESKALTKFLDKGELINFKEPGARKIDRDVRSKGAVKIRSTGRKPPPPIRDEMGQLIPKNKRQLAQIKTQQDRIRKRLGMGAKGIYCTPCTRRAVQEMKAKIARIRNTPADEIVSKFEKFINKTPSIKGVNGVFDPDTNRILDATDPNDSKLLQKKFGRGNDKIGFNSITDTRKGPESNIALIRKQLRNIEKKGGTPALGLDEGSLEAVDVARGRTDNDILGKLDRSQRSTGILTPNKKFKIADNPNFNM